MNYTIDCAGIPDKHSLHLLIAQTLSFPDYYGHNLDALMDCLTDIREPSVITVQNWQMLDDWALGFWETLLDAQRENANITVIFA